MCSHVTIEKPMETVELGVSILASGVWQKAEGKTGSLEDGEPEERGRCPSPGRAVCFQYRDR